MATQRYYDEEQGEWIEYDDGVKLSPWTQIKAQLQNKEAISSKHATATSSKHELTTEERSRAGHVTASKMSSDERRARAQKAAQKRWGK